MKFSLKNIANISSGIYRKPNLSGNIIYLQAKHFNEAGNIVDNGELPRDIKSDSKLARHILFDKDILFAAKGVRHFAYLYDVSIGTAVASSTFFVIRLKQGNNHDIIPDFLHWYLNHPVTQALLKTYAMGSSVLSVSKKALSDIEIPVLPINNQKKILQIHALWQREKSLNKQILDKKEQLYQSILFKLATKKNDESKG